MGSQYSLDVACGDAIVIVTRAATLRIDCHKMDGNWSLLLQYGADSQGSDDRRKASRGQSSVGYSGQASVPSFAGTSQGRFEHGRGDPVLRDLIPKPIRDQSTRHGETPQVGGFQGRGLPATGTPGQAIPGLLLTPRQTAKALSICERTLYSLTKRGEIPAIKIGRLVRYDPDVLKQWIGRHSKKTGG